MKTRIQKWGNSLALRIPKPFAVDAGLEPDTTIELCLVDGKLVITPLAEPFALEALLAGITADNLHEEINTGPAVGNESW